MMVRFIRTKEGYFTYLWVVVGVMILSTIVASGIHIYNFFGS